MHVVLKVTLRTTDGVYMEGLLLKSPLTPDVETELKNHPEWFEVHGNIKDVATSKQEATSPETPKPATKKKTSSPVKK